MSAGLVSATDAAIHTTQMQVDEVTVIRLSPIVYNKELMKRELLDLITLVSPHTKAINVKKDKKQREDRKEKRNSWKAHMLSYFLSGGGRRCSLNHR